MYCNTHVRYKICSCPQLTTYIKYMHTFAYIKDEDRSLQYLLLWSLNSFPWRFHEFCVTMVTINTPVVELVHLLSGLLLQRNTTDAVTSCKHVYNLSVYICSCICITFTRKSGRWRCSVVQTEAKNREDLMRYAWPHSVHQFRKFCACTLQICKNIRPV